MKTFLFSLFIAVTLLYSCANDSSIKIKTTGNDVASPQLIDTLMADKMAIVYSYDSTYTDSTLVCRQWFLKDSLLKKVGDFNQSLPFTSGFLEEYIVTEAKGKPLYETFDSLICEVGGHSAWNKYLFTYDNMKRPATIKHYKAWYENYDEEGNVYNSSKPDYALAQHIHFTYSGGRTQQIITDEARELKEKITSIVDDQSRLSFEELYYLNEHRFRIYYRYNDRLQPAAAL